MANPKQHIDVIRKTKFSIGRELNPLTEDLHQAVKNLSAELYAKDVHFLMELIQNSEDNEYSDGVNPSLEFVITSRDITRTGALATLLIFNNERGFTAKNIESICSVGRSTKKGNRRRGYIGEKGIGFKSVFLVTARPYIFSNGYKIRFSEEPCPLCNIGYIVPEWVEEYPTVTEINQIYGTGTTLPTTTIVLPLKPDKIKPVKQQLSGIHPEILLFLSKIKKLSVKEDNEDCSLNTVSAISISSDTNFLTRKTMDAESFVLHLSSEECSNTSDKECSYYMWKQKFPVKRENIDERRRDIEEWVITLAFPFGQRLHRGMSSPGVYAFLPTEMVTNFPFIIQADFLLASSRETILLNKKWNQGILDCVPIAFVNAFISLVKTTESTPVFNLPNMFMFLPVDNSSYSELNKVRESIREKLLVENIIPGQSYVEQKFFHKPCEVGRLLPTFWCILDEARGKGVSLHNLSSHGRYILSSSFDRKEYDPILTFLGVEYVDSEWYGKCLQSTNIVLGVPDDVYLELLHFLADNWGYFQSSNIKNIPLLKYVGYDNSVSLCSLRETCQNGVRNILVSSDYRPMSWLINWSIEFRCVGDHFFMPKTMQEAMHVHSKKYAILKWLKEWANVGVVTVHEFANLIHDSLGADRKLIAFVHFLFHSFSNKYMSEEDVKGLCHRMPLLDNYGHVRTERKRVLVPANGSKWVQLIGTNPWRNLGYIELGEEYLNSGSFAGLFAPQNQLLHFLKTYVGASDIPDVSPPNAVIPTVSAPLTKQNVFLLLDWIQNLRCKRITRPDMFIRSIKEGSFLKILLSGSSGYRPPSQSFMLSSSDGNLLQNGSVFVDIPLIDESFYGEKLKNYREELKEIGVVFEIGEACRFIGKHLMSLADSAILTKANFCSILNFIKFLREKYLPLDEFLNAVNKGSWIKTSLGYKSPRQAVLYNQEWKAASEISNIPFVDNDYYGEEIVRFKQELKCLGVDSGFNENYQFVASCLKSPSHLTSLSAEAVLLILQCLRHSSSSGELVKSLKGTKFLKTNLGYKSPDDCFFFNPEWGSLLLVFNCFPLIDQNMYGKNIFSYVQELKQLGVKVDFEEAAKAFAGVFRFRAASNGLGTEKFVSFGKENVLLLLACYRKLKKSAAQKLPLDLKKCIREVKWLRTRLGDYRSPSECILFGPKWESIDQITRLPFINDSEKYYGHTIHAYKEELKSMGVVTDFHDGVKFITTNLYLPDDPQIITPVNMISLLECIRIMLKDGKDSIPEVFMEKVSAKWVKTSKGYMSPKESLLFNCKWDSLLKQTDGPFIDSEFYGSDIMTYEKELESIGVIVDVAKGDQLLSNHLCDTSDFTTIVRLYSYLSKVNWKPSNESAGQIWIPDRSENGMWVNHHECVLHDKDGLFGARFNVLDTHYELKLLSFFSRAFEVKSSPSVDDYCELWKVWESSGSPLSNAECCAFWGYIVKHWGSKTEKIIVDNLTKLPVSSGLNEALLLDKNDVFVADDLQLKDIFEKSSAHAIFAWYPRSSNPALPRSKLIEVYHKIGVRTISEALVTENLSIDDGVELKEVNPSESFIGKQLVKLILGYLSDPSINMETEKRHKTVKCLIHATVLQTVEPIFMGYNLSLSSGEVLSVKASQLIRWDKEKSKIFMQKMDKIAGYKNKVEYAIYFAEVIAEGVLWENEDLIYGLSELIKLAFMVEFDEEAVGFLMKNQNLIIFAEDEEFLSSAFLPNSSGKEFQRKKKKHPGRRTSI